jgi:hypothetical protein
VKYVLAWAGLSALFAFSQAVDSILVDIATVGAAVLALGVLRQKVGKPLVRFARKADRAIDVMLALPGRVDRLERRLEADVTVRHEVHQSKEP